MTISMTAIVAGEMKQLIYDLRVEENRFDIELRDLARNKKTAKESKLSLAISQTRVSV